MSVTRLHRLAVVLILLGLGGGCPSTPYPSPTATPPRLSPGAPGVGSGSDLKSPSFNPRPPQPSPPGK